MAAAPTLRSLSGIPLTLGGPPSAGGFIRRVASAMSLGRRGGAPPSDMPPEPIVQAGPVRLSSSRTNPMLLALVALQHADGSWDLFGGVRRNSRVQTGGSRVRTRRRFRSGQSSPGLGYGAGARLAGRARPSSARRMAPSRGQSPQMAEFCRTARGSRQILDWGRRDLSAAESLTRSGPRSGHSCRRGPHCLTVSWAALTGPRPLVPAQGVWYALAPLTRQGASTGNMGLRAPPPQGRQP